MKMSKIVSPIAKCLLAAVLLACSVQTIKFDCNFERNYMSTYDLWALRYSCNASVIASGSTSLDSVTGIHEIGQSNDDVTFLNILQQKLTSVPEGIGNVFKNLDILCIKESSLTSISANDLRQFPSLVHLNLYRNQLTSIDGDLFAYTPQLEQVNFDRNKILHIGQGLVTNLNNLIYLVLTNKFCIANMQKLKPKSYC